MDAEITKKPNGWAITNLEDIVEILDSHRIPLNSSERVLRKGSYPYYGANGQVDTIDNYIFDGDFALLAEDGGYFDDPSRPVAYHVSGKFWANNHVHILKPLGLIPAQFLIQNLNHADLMPFVGGTTRLKLNQAAMRKIPLLLPPLNEQIRIVARIEELQARNCRAREALETVPDLLDQLRQSILAAAFRGDLTKEWRERNPNVEPATELLKRIRAERRKRWEESELEKLKVKGLSEDKLQEAFAIRLKQYKEPSPVDATELPELPEGWCWVNLDVIKEYSIYGPRFSNEAYSQRGTIILRTTDIDSYGKVDTVNAPRIDLSNIEKEKYIVKKGDLLITRTGSIGTLTVFNDDVETIPGAFLLHYRLAWDASLSWLIFHQLKSPRCQHAMTGGSAGTGRPNLNAPTLEAIPLALPPVDEQAIILNRIDSHLQTIGMLRDRLRNLLYKNDRLDQSILTKAFRGELVPQDPNDESASALLERIKQEKVRAIVKPKIKDKRNMGAHP